MRNARHAKGLTQAQVADEDASVAYVSRIESGQRRPDAKLLEGFARRLDVTADHLLRGVDPDHGAGVELALDLAELALASGNIDEALAGSAEVMRRTEDGALPEVRLHGGYVRGLALEAAGQLDAAILTLEDLLVEAPQGRVSLSCAIALSRCYRESGDLARAIDTGTETLRVLDACGLEGGDEAVQLTVTVAAAHFERGDVGHAVRICERAMERAEKLGSPKAKASAYWNASVMRSKKGEVEAAVPLAKKALALLETGGDLRNLARLRSELGICQLRLDPPAVEDAQLNLEQARRELEWSSASPIDTARNKLALARADFLSGDLARAVERADEVYAVARTQAPLLAADALVLQGQIAVCAGDTGSAQSTYREAILALSSIGADRGAAQLWFELGGLLEEIGATDEARDAYRRAAASTGLTDRRARHVMG
jgi:tetratricopeptide (TPR) repeat protein